jgi:hypothetical protein
LGVRYQNFSATVNLSHTFSRRPYIGAAEGLCCTSSGAVDGVDPVIGFATNYRSNEKWFLEGYGDVGGFWVGSKLTSEGIVEVGYNWTPSVSSELGFRILYNDYQRGNGNGGRFRYDTTMYGPVVALSYHF